MGETTHISWCDHTFNPWEGCTKVSPGCLHCYAETRNARFGGGTAPNWGIGAPRRRTSVQNWNQVRKWDIEAVKFQYNHGADKFAMSQWHRPRVFCASLADWLDDEVPIEWLADLLELIRKTKALDWLLLTKRPQNFAARLWEIAGNASLALPVRQFAGAWVQGLEIPSNVWIGTTVEDQTRADERIPLLLKIPAKVRFLSCEPLLGPVTLRMGNVMAGFPRHITADGSAVGAPLNIHWVICGGESGPGARPMHPDWARSLRLQCAAAGVAFHFKQHGEWIARSQYLHKGHDKFWEATRAGKKYQSAVMRRDGPIDKSLGEASTTNDDDSAIYKAGKAITGHLLDGREHLEFPTT